MLDIIQIPVLTDNYIYLLHDPVSEETAVIDPALAQPVLGVLDKKGWRLAYILNTHHHWDHVGGNLELKQKTACKIIAAQSDRDRIPVLILVLTKIMSSRWASTRPGLFQLRVIPADISCIILLKTARCFAGIPYLSWAAVGCSRNARTNVEFSTKIEGFTIINPNLLHP